MLDVEEIEEKLDDFLKSLEGDFEEKDFCMAYNNIAKKEGWTKRIGIVDK